MSVYKIFPEKDATLYSLYPTANTGLDEIIEATITPSANQILTSTAQASRFLIQFSQQELLNLSQSYLSTPTTFSASLRTFAANVTNINQTTVLDVLAVTGSWNNGTGKYGDTPATTNGVSWLYRSADAIDPWITSSFPAGVTASFPTTNEGGGNWLTNAIYNQSQSFEYSNPVDVNVDVTQTVEGWLNGSIDNSGFILKQRQEFIDSSSFAAILKFFSIDTNTIYPPCLEFKWRDYIFNTGSSTNTIIDQDNIYISLQNNEGTFKPGAINKFRLNVRPKYPIRVFQTTPIYTNNYYLPTASYYAIQDVDTNEYIVDFNETFTQISADDNSSYFTLYMNGFEPERYYKVLVKTHVAGNTYIIDEQQYFKVSK
jgi:hypothetical protein